MVWILYRWLPPLPGMETLADRLGLAMRWLFIWLAVCPMALVTMLDGAQMRLVPIVCCFFVFGRLVFWWGYLRAGTLGRAPGVQTTLALNVPVPLPLHVAVLLGRSLLAGRA